MDPTVLALMRMGPGSYAADGSVAAPARRRRRLGGSGSSGGAAWVAGGPSGPYRAELELDDAHDGCDHPDGE